MAENIENFQIEFKKRLYKFTLDLIKFIDKLPKDNTTNRIYDQLIRSGTSIIGNYIEGQSASSKKDFINYFNHCLKSSNESKLWFSLLKDSGRANESAVNPFLSELKEISNIFASSLLKLKGKK